MNRSRLHGLYAITAPPADSSVSLIIQVEQALLGGARVIQYRDKSGERTRRQHEATALAKLCQKHDALLIINDDPALALAVGASGVHLGRDDAAYAEARALLGPDAIIGVSCYNQLDLAAAAQEMGADYIAFGRFFPSRSKPLAVQADPNLLRQARRALSLPLVAIGGITPENGGLLIAAGADMLAVIHGVFGQPDIRAASAQYKKLFQPEESRS